MGSGVFDGFITLALPVTIGYEWRQPSLVLLPLVGQVMKRLMNPLALMCQNHKHSGSRCV